MAPPDRSKRITGNLVAAASVAVVAVYAAGYARTSAAAARFDQMSDQRRPAPHVGGDSALHASAQQPLVAIAAPVATVARANVDSAHPAKDQAAKQRANVSNSANDSAPSVATSTAARTPDSAAQTAAASTPKDTTPAPVQAPVAAAPQPAPAPTPAPASVFKDGVYSGWGSSRHGQIEATVEIRDGRIVSATITQCLMHYSCSWIAHLPGQVVTRQSPEVDFVSGATQSTNSFYYAVVDALSKAK